MEVFRCSRQQNRHLAGKAKYDSRHHNSFLNLSDFFKEKIRQVYRRKTKDVKASASFSKRRDFCAKNLSVFENNNNNENNEKTIVSDLT